MRLFNGTTSRIDIANESSFDFERTQPFSVSAWIYLNAASSFGAIVAKQASSGNFEGWILGLDTGRVFGELRSSGSSDLEMLQDVALQSGRWHQVGFTYDGSSSASGMIVYVNGAVPAQTAAADTLSSSILNNVPVQLGCRGGSGAPAFFFNGRMRDVAVWPAELSASEMALLGAGTDPSLVGSFSHSILTRNASNPLIRNNSSYDDLKAGPHAVVKMGAGDYRMWYEAIDDPSLDTKVAYATSSDGTSWTKYGSNPVMSFGDAWENSEVAPPMVMWDADDSLFKMWFHGGGNGAERKIGYASSADGISWTKSGSNPILSDTSAWTGGTSGVSDCKVLKFGAADYRMWYRSIDAWKYGYATSADGISWTKYGSNPVLSGGGAGTWESSGVMAMSLLWDSVQELYHAFYMANDGSVFGIGYASSPDGIAWTKSPDNPLLVNIAGDMPTDSIHAYLDGTLLRLVYGQYDLTASPVLRGIGEATVRSPLSAWKMRSDVSTEPDSSDSNPGTLNSAPFASDPDVEFAFDTFTSSTRTGTQDPYTFNHAGAAANVGGVIVTAAHGTSATDHIVGVTYGGVSLLRVQTNTDTATELGRSDLWFLGDKAAIPDGTQTVSVDLSSATTDDIHFVCMTVIAPGNTEVIDNDGINENVANPTVTMNKGGRSAMSFAVLYGGGGSAAGTIQTGCQRVATSDLGNFYSDVLREDSPDTSDQAIGFSTLTSDDVAFSAIAVAPRVSEAVTARGRRRTRTLTRL